MRAPLSKPSAFVPRAFVLASSIPEARAMLIGEATGGRKLFGDEIDGLLLAAQVQRFLSTSNLPTLRNAGGVAANTCNKSVTR